MFFRKAFAFLERDARDYLSCKTQIFLEAASILAQVFIFFYISKFLNGESLPVLGIYGENYFAFALTGMALAGFQSTALESFAKAVSREQGSGTLEAVFLSPTSLQTVIFSSLFWSSVFSFLKLSSYLFCGFFIFKATLGSVNLLSAACVLVLTLSALSGLGMISAGCVLIFKRSDPLGYVLNGLSRLLSGVYFPVTVLPVWIRALSAVLPLTYSLEAMRKSVFEGASVREIIPELSVLMAATAFLLPLGWLFFKWSVDKSRRDGTLSFV